ncbi:MAG: transglutaminase domain-containing protein [Chloroflexota bacterium]
MLHSPPCVQEENGQESQTAPESINGAESHSNGQPEDVGATDKATPTRQEIDDEDAASSDCVFIDAAENHLDHRDPSVFLTPGPQSRLSASNADRIKDEIDEHRNSLETVTAVFEWKHSHFHTDNVGGAYVGTLTVDDIMERGSLSGCHDHGIVLASVLREYGLPAVMVDAAGMQWASDYNAGTTERFIGHIFLEIWLGTEWILLDSTSGEYLVGYDPCDPVIPVTKSIEPLGYYALLKGLDPADYGVHSIDDLKTHMDSFPARAETTDLTFPAYEQHRLQV